MSQKTAQMPQYVRKPVMQQIFEHPERHRQVERQPAQQEHGTWGHGSDDGVNSRRPLDSASLL